MASLTQLKPCDQQKVLTSATLSFTLQMDECPTSKLNVWFCLCFDLSSSSSLSSSASVGGTFLFQPAEAPVDKPSELRLCSVSSAGRSSLGLSSTEMIHLQRMRKVAEEVQEEVKLQLKC